MATYFIGDIQGCYQELRDILSLVDFTPGPDKLWVTGDMVARGPESLKVLRYLRALGSNTRIVLGNHDLHLLAVYHGISKNKQKDRLSQVIEADDAPGLMEWLRHQPLVQADPKRRFIMTHAGINPAWTINQTISLAAEVESHLQGQDFIELLRHMYGNEPAHWHDDLEGYDRLRVVINMLTRMRYCYTDASLNMAEKGPPESLDNSNLHPWFELEGEHLNQKVIFGHWASLMGHSTHPNAIALDTGCVWGNQMTLYRLEDEQYFYLSCAHLKR